MFMNTNYEKMTFFDCAVVITAVIGIALIGAEFYNSTSVENRTEVIKALSIFDLNKPISNIWSQSQIGFDPVDEFYKQFYLSFEQTFSYPQIGQSLISASQSFGQYADSVLAQKARSKQSGGQFVIWPDHTRASISGSQTEKSPSSGKSEAQPLIH